MGKLTFYCTALALVVQAQAQTPTVTAVTNDRWSSPTLSPGAVGYVFGSNFGTTANTTVAVGGLDAPVLAVSSSQILARFPADLPAGRNILTVTVDGKVSQPVNVLVSRRASGQRPAIAYSPSRRVKAPTAPLSAEGSQATLATAGSGIVFTCDPSVTALSAGACTTLNTTIAGLYRSAFSNANASIYVTLGTTELGQSAYVSNPVDYGPFRDALIAGEGDANDTTAVNSSVPLLDPFGNASIDLPNGLARALGFSATTGFLTDGATFCGLGASGCYDGTITISNSAPLYFRTGSISQNQFDFFSIVEHETDEILGTASCVFGCSGDIAPTDYFRYHSNGQRSFTPGSNNPCSSSDSTNACFSLDGIHMLQQYNNVDNGEDGGDWLPNCSAPLVQDAASCTGVAGVDISPTAEILLLDVIGYTLASSATGAVTNVTSSAANGTYGAGASIPIQITFNETVTVTGTPQLALNSGGTASYSSGSGTGTLTFSYLVAAGQSSARLDYTSISALTLNGGSIKGPGSSAVSLTLATPGAAGSLSGNKAIVISTSTSTSTTIQTNPSGLQFSVDGGAAQIAPQTLNLSPGSHTVSVATQQSGGTGIREAFSSWSDGGAASHSITVGTTAATYTANFTTTFQLTMSASPAAGGTFTPAGGTFYFPGSVIPITATPNSGYTFSNWTGSVANSTNAATTVTMNAPETVIANFSVTVPPTALAFFRVTPCRVADTRSGSGQFGAPSMAGGSTRNFNITQSACNIPTTAQAYSLNVTAVPPAPLTYLSIWPAGQTQPTVSTLNSFDGQVVANAAIVPAGTSPAGAISIFVSNTTDVLIDIDGYFAPPATGGLAFYPLTPCRIADTRGSTSTFGGPQMAAGSTRNFPVPFSACAVPATAQAYSLNMTVVPPASLIYLTTWPAGVSQPTVSTLNSFNGRVLANAAIVPAGTGGAIDVFVSNASDVIIDINGYFAPPGGTGALYFYKATPCRIADTRAGSGFPTGFGPPTLAANSTRTFAIRSSGCGLPATAQAYSFNMTAVPPAPLIYLTTWPTGVTQPVVSTLNAINGTVVANAAIVPAGTSGSINIFVSNSTDFILDVNGYFAP